MKYMISTLAITATCSAVVKLNKSISNNDITSCQEWIQIIVFPVFEKQIDGCFRNEDNSIIVKNNDDEIWFIMDSNLGTVVSFDQAKCPTENEKWHLLDLGNMNYSDYDIQFL